MTITSNTATINVSSGRKALYNDGLFISAEEIAIIKTQLNRDPWLTSFNLLESAAVNALSATEEYFADHNYCCYVDNVAKTGCTYGSAGGCADYATGQRIRDRIRALGMYYALTGKEEYAAKVVSWIKKLLLNDSTKLNPNIIHHYTYASIIAGVLYGAQLTLKSSAWDSSSKATFKSWCASTGNTYKNFHMEGDFAYSKIYLVIICGILTDNNTLINSQISGTPNSFKERIKPDIGTDGRIITQAKRQGCGGCTVGCPQSGTTPLCATGDKNYARNFCCGLSYNGLGTRHIITIAELLRHKNIDFYTPTWTIDDGGGSKTSSIEKMLDFNAIFYDKLPSWYLDAAAVTRDYKYCTLAMKCFIGQNRDIFELGYSFFKKTSYKNAIIRWGRAGLFDERVMGYVTLTHGIPF